MKKFREYWRRWYVQLIIILIPFILGLVGYYAKYTAPVVGKVNKMPDMVLYSTIRLFGFMFDADPGYAWYDYVLAVARWLAIIPTGNVLIRLLQPLTARFFSEIGFRFWNRRSDRLLIFGANSECRQVYNTAEGFHPMIRCNSEDDFKQLRKDGYRCVQMTAETVMSEAIAKTFSSENRKCRIVIREQDEELNLHLCRIAVQEIRKELEGITARHEAIGNGESSGGKQEDIRACERQIVRKMEQIRIVVFGDRNLESAYLNLVQQSCGILRYTNKYRLTAVELIEQYPLVRFMDRKKHMDAAGLVPKDLDLNVILVGFGDMNQELFESSMMVNQFATAGDGEIPEYKKVFYHIYDREEVHPNKNLNHMAFRFEHVFCSEMNSHMIRKEDYLPMPDDPGQDIFHQTNINAQAFYEEIWKITTNRKDSVNVIAISFGSDLENIDLAQKLKAKVKEWNVGNIRLFVRIRKAENISLIRDNLSDGLIAFGNEMRPFEMRYIFSDKLEKMARDKHYMNALIRSRAGNGFSGDDEEIRLHSLYEWHTYDPLKRRSSLYAILSIRSKLLMMGLDYREKTADQPYLRSNREYFDLYAKGDSPRIDRVIDSLRGMEIYDYGDLLTEDTFRDHTMRKTLAVQEHLRWNAFMICNGFVPATKAQIRAGSVQDYDLRFHGCLTTFQGLFEYRRLLTETNGKPEINNDKINYDFHLMDDAWWYLDMFGYEIFRSEG